MPPVVPNCCPKKPHLYFAIILFILWIFGLDHLIFEVCFKEFFTMPGMSESPNLLMVLLGYLFAGILFVALYWYASCPPGYEPCNKDKKKALERGAVIPNVPKHGVIFGILIALIVFLPYALILCGLMEGWDLKPALAEVGYRVVQFGIGGYLVARMIGYHELE